MERHGEIEEGKEKQFHELLNEMYITWGLCIGSDIMRIRQNQPITHFMRIHLTIEKAQ